MTAEEIEKDWLATLEAWFVDPRRVPLKRGVKELLHWLHSSASPPVPCVVATSNDKAVVERALAVHGIASYFAGVFTSSDAAVAHPKPAPDVYVAAARAALASRPEELALERVLVVEDHCESALNAQRLGMKVCAVHDDYPSSAAEWPVFSAAADFAVMASLDELIPPLRAWFFGKSAASDGAAATSQ